MARPVRGILTAVTDPKLGTTLAADHAAGASVLQVVDALDFDEAGGTLQLGTETLTYTGIDDDDDTILLAGVTANAWDEGEEVIRLPEVRQKIAWVSIADEGDAIPARVPSNWWTSVVAAISDPSVPATALLRFDDGKYVLDDIEGVERKILAETITGPIPTESLSDGFAPDTAPVVTVEPFGIGGVRASWAAVPNADPVTYDVYASLTSGFTPGPSTLVESTNSLTASVSRLDGAQLPLDASTLVYMVVIPRDADGVGPASVEASSSTLITDVEQLAALIGTFALLQAQQIIGGEFIVDVGLAKRLQAGPYIDIDGETSSITIYADVEHSTPLIQLRPEGSVFRGQVIADDISVLNGLLLLGTDSQVSTDSGLTLMNGVPDPKTAPTLSSGLLTSAFPVVPSGFQSRGINWDHVDSCWIRLIVPTSGSIVGNCKVQKINASTGAVDATITLGNVAGGVSEKNMNTIVRVGDSYYSAVGDSAYGSAGGVGICRWTTAGAWTSWDLLSVDEGYNSGVYALGYSPAIPTKVLFARPSGGLTIFGGFEPGLAVTYGSVPGGANALAWLGGLPDGSFGLVRQAGNYTAPWLALSFDPATDTAFNELLTLEGRDTAYRPSAGWSTATAATIGRYSTFGDGEAVDWSEKVWVKSANTGGGFTTAASPAGSRSVLKGRYVTVSLQPGPTGATDADVFAGVGSTEPITADMDRRTETLTSTSGARTMTFDPAVTGDDTKHPPTTSTFGAGNPGWIKSQVDDFEVNGDGSGSWKRYGLDESDTYWDWTDIASTAFSNYGVTGDRPRFRVRHGFLEIRGVVKPAAAANATAVNGTSVVDNCKLGDLPSGVASRIGMAEPMVPARHQGSGTQSFALRLANTGAIHLYRHSGTSSTSEYMPFNVVFGLED